MTIISRVRIRIALGAGTLALIVLSLGMPTAQAAPTIAFLNPSGYSSPIKISDVTDQDGSVHLVAWAQEIPSQALVEFEFEPAGQNPLTFTADRVGADTWEVFFSIPDQYSDGSNYVLRARLYQGVPGDADEVANAEMAVEVNQSEVPPPIAGTVELTYPDNGAQLGFFRPPGKRPSAVFDYVASDYTESVRTFYTVSAPGSSPSWTTCGQGIPDAAGSGKVRCKLANGNAPKEVTGVAIVSNKTSPSSGPPNPALDDTGDAHRVLPYVQQPGSPTFSAPPDPSPGNCSFMTVSLSDQFNRPIAGANIDLHAKGPNDKLRFMTEPGQTSPYKAPNRKHESREPTKRCADNSNFRKQGDHNVRKGPDIKHVESKEGTSIRGSFSFALRSPAPGKSKIRVWVDRNGDDTKDNAEPARSITVVW